MSKLSFFIGKGGVGKTTLAAAYAVRTAALSARRPVLLISTDPAHSLADIFEIKLAGRVRAVTLSRTRRLWVWQINPEEQFRRFLDRHREAILGLVESATIFSRAEIQPLLDTTLPGMAEFSALLALKDVARSGRYSEIVVDTAPLGHTLRLFQMPDHFARFLEFLDLAASRDRVLAGTFGGGMLPSQPFVEEWRQTVAEVREALSRRNAGITLVTTPETFSLAESVRAREPLQASGVAVTAVVLNRAVARASSCPRCARKALATREARRFLSREFSKTSILIAEDHGGPVIGANDLRAFAAHVFAGSKFITRCEAPHMAAPRLQRSSWPDLQTPLSLTLGKGGVGKTTISAALAAYERAVHPRRSVVICSTDPAPSLDDVFQAPVDDEPAPVLGDAGLLAVEVDSVREFRHWSEGLRQRIEQAFGSEAGGVHVDLSFDRKMISALLDIVPPGVDEIFAIFRILDLLSEKRTLVIDMAPTGHALELLRMPERLAQWSRLLLKCLAPHRRLPFAQDAAVEIAGVGQRVRELLSFLRDARHTRAWAVMLAEPLPDRETGRLLGQLREVGINTAPVFVNRIIFPDQAGSCARCRRAHAWQMATLASIRRRLGREVYVVREFDKEVAGARALKAFTRELWRLA